ncbi:Bar adaptor protein [Mycena sanguinolenta]|uniref:Bar adaptor protein n=1 Tax=Mycena sanguinolenta TaxID=230812 RepID=A0A8H6YUI7_9AGAR|nr:Bar adaptor protein [Mycena sanguinolenta]
MIKGIGKTIKRTPHNLGSKVGLSKKSTDPEFDDYQRHFVTMEKAAETLLKDTKSFTDAINSLFTSGAGFATHFSTLFHPIAGEYDLIGKNPDSAQTIRSVTKYETAMEELRTAISPELDLIESRVVGPIKELQQVMKLIRKSITKRDHKLTDYDRFNNSLTKLRDKKEKSLSDEKNLFKLEQDFELATNEYDFLNNALKTDLPRFMTLSTQFIDPPLLVLLLHAVRSFAFRHPRSRSTVPKFRLNIFYLILEKMNGFAEDAKYDVTNTPGSQITSDYEGKRTDAWSRIEDLNITKRIISTSKMVQANRSASGGSTLGRSATTASSSSAGSLPPPRAPAPARVPSNSNLKKVPPPVPGSSAAAPPPPYSPAAASAAAATKRAPPPPPPLKPKPKVAPKVQYVVALYDFAAQADGDLSFSTGDRIEVVERGASAEDWWTGRLNGQQGVFPGNYVQES